MRFFSLVTIDLQCLVLSLELCFHLGTKIFLESAELRKRTGDLFLPYPKRFSLPECIANAWS